MCQLICLAFVSVSVSANLLAHEKDRDFRDCSCIWNVNSRGRDALYTLRTCCLV